MNTKYFLSYVLLLLLLSPKMEAQSSKKELTPKAASWNNIKSYFIIPENFAKEYGDYRSPLLFYNGDSVKTKSDWQKRREEIYNKWSEILGTWPPIIKDQTIKILEKETKDNFTKYRVRFYWMPNEETEAYLLIPNKKGKKPAIITTFYEPQTAIGKGNKPHRDYALQLTKRGFVTLSIGTSKTTENKTYSLYYPGIENATVQPLSTLAYAAANAWEVLAKLDDVDSLRIGIVGHSYGGKWAMFASCLYKKFACAAWSDPGIVFDETKGSLVNYWAPWYLGYYPPPWEDAWSKKPTNENGVYTKLKKDGFDLHELHALMAPRPFLVSGGSSDPTQRWIPLNHSLAVYRHLGYTNRVAMSNRPTHDPNFESNEIIYSFFEYFLEPLMQENSRNTISP